MMVGDLLRGSVAIAAILIGNALAQEHLQAGEGLRDGAFMPGRGRPQFGDLPFCVPRRRVAPPHCPKA